MSKRLFFALMAIFMFCKPAYALEYKMTGRTGMASFNYTVPASSGTTTGLPIGVAVDLLLWQNSSFGLDINLGLGLSDKIINFSQVHFLYKYYLFTYTSVVITGEADTAIQIQSRFYPYIGGGIGYSTLIVKSSITAGVPTLISTNSQFFDFALVLGTDISIGTRWGLNTQLLISQGQGNTSTGNLTATGYALGVGGYRTF